ncbi:MAG: type I methionyl aminopeptidase [Verrucomicrobia bacterium]|nr:MAG: type I methionyl aminopeptidase [Verrucomicrobiota bacterium]TAE87977.1 MAG: type I methionyl aminopeptidase [Verrucomicrobiota bacterium]TAF26201.1 MAG: type I methionyl aminopeptidase [Verrucomicrobiota bacterium]TAF41756.1 MAG: type I methionyl aminopeptidase [Verrucomicrobiota bacterium]
MARRNRIRIKTAHEIARMRVAGEIASDILQELAKAVRPGCTTLEIDQLALELMRERDCKSAFLGYRGFSGQICISVNEEVVHGIGGPRKIQAGDAVKIDVGIVKGGWIGDNALTVAVGDVSDEVRRLLIATEESLFAAIAHARAGERLAELCGAVEAHVKPLGFTVVREFVGHGVGRELHEEPQVPNYRPQGKSPILEPGMVLAIEPMVNAGVAGVRILDDGWTVITADGKSSAHFEHTVLITSGEPEILTPRPRGVPGL